MEASIIYVRFKAAANEVRNVDCHAFFSFGHLPVLVLIAKNVRMILISKAKRSENFS